MTNYVIEEMDTEVRRSGQWSELQSSILNMQQKVDRLSAMITKPQTHSAWDSYPKTKTRADAQAERNQLEDKLIEAKLDLEQLTNLFFTASAGAPVTVGWMVAEDDDTNIYPTWTTALSRYLFGGREPEETDLNLLRVERVAVAHVPRRGI